MNLLMIVVVVFVLFCYFGGKYCPSVLKKNKKILLGLAGGLVLCSFFGMRLEGLCVPTEATIRNPPATHPRTEDLATLCPQNATGAECQQQYCNYTDDAATDAAALVTDHQASVAFAQDVVETTAAQVLVDAADATLGTCWDEMMLTCGNSGHGPGQLQSPCAGCVLATGNTRVRAACGEDITTWPAQAFCTRPGD